jgi:hypothetical protein
LTFQVSWTTLNLSKTVALQLHFRTLETSYRATLLDCFLYLPCELFISRVLRLTLWWLSRPFCANITMTTPSSDSPPPSSATPNIITLHVLSPAPEVTGGRITFSSISLDTTISQLKARLQNSITGRPLPERQRLIYRGRALGDGSLSLKTIFQSEVS